MEKWVCRWLSSSRQGRGGGGLCPPHHRGSWPHPPLPLALRRAQTSMGSRPRFCLFTTNTLCPDTVTSNVCSPKTTDRRLKGMLMPWCSRKPQAVLTSSEMALAACSSFSRSPDDANTAPSLSTR
uniref:Ragulator complex protein LAMTOR4 isoform X5 n=1 Tax=Sus scrofa TaxID=9823 RepID=A0A480I698_PIG